MLKKGNISQKNGSDLDKIRIIASSNKKWNEITKKVLTATRKEDYESMWRQYNKGHFTRRKNIEKAIMEKTQLGRCEFPWCGNQAIHTSLSLCLNVCENHKVSNVNDLHITRKSLSFGQRAKWAQRLRKNKVNRERDLFIYQQEENEKEKLYESIQEEKENEEEEKELTRLLKRSRPSHTYFPR